MSWSWTTRSKSTKTVWRWVTLEPDAHTLCQIHIITHTRKNTCTHTHKHTQTMRRHTRTHARTHARTHTQALWLTRTHDTRTNTGLQSFHKCCFTLSWRFSKGARFTYLRTTCETSTYTHRGLGVFHKDQLMKYSMGTENEVRNVHTDNHLEEI